MPNTPVTKVVFRVMGGEVLAIFPEEPADVNGSLCVSYSHFGQHGGADYCHCIRKSRPATRADYTPLKNELEKMVGYKLKVCKRAPVGSADIRRRALI